jgi:hypothetical protein
LRFPCVYLSYPSFQKIWSIILFLNFLSATFNFSVIWFSASIDFSPFIMGWSSCFFIRVFWKNIIM